MRLLSIFMAGLAITVLSAAERQPDQESDGEKCSRIVSAYYLDPQPAKVTELLELLANGAIPDEKIPMATAPLIGFFGEVFRANSDSIPEWRRQIADMKSEPMRTVLYSALLYAGTDAAKTAMNKLREQFPDLPTPPETQKKSDFTLQEITDPRVLDSCWGAFFATGDAKFPQTVLHCALRREPENGIDLSARAARWSLLSIARQNPLVGKAVMDYLKKNPDRQADFEQAFSAEERQALAAAAAKAEQKPEIPEKPEGAKP